MRRPTSFPSLESKFIELKGRKKRGWCINIRLKPLLTAKSADLSVRSKDVTMPESAAFASFIW